jgi:DNA-binding response OmpR family regulator
MSDILVVDDDVKIARIIARYLTDAGFSCSLAHDGRETWQSLRESAFDLLILDVLLPDTTGLQILADLRRSQAAPERSGAAAGEQATATAADVPVLILSALGMTDDIIDGLRSGADDYLVKPFEPRELVERVRTLLRRQQRNARPATLTLGNLTLNRAARVASLGDRIVDLGRREYELLVFMADHPEQVFSRGQLLDAVWGDDYDGSDRAVDLCILRLRSKLRAAGAVGFGVLTAWGAGYRLALDPEGRRER